MNHKQIHDYNLMAYALDEIEEMFTALDQYRKTGNKTHLYKAHNHEGKARRLMKNIPQETATQLKLIHAA